MRNSDCMPDARCMQGRCLVPPTPSAGNVGMSQNTNSTIRGGSVGQSGGTSGKGGASAAGSGSTSNAGSSGAKSGAGSSGLVARAGTAGKS
jgi:hypothetical protein